MSRSMPDTEAVVVAAGTSSRMAGVDKVTVAVCGRPLLAWTLDAFAAARSVGSIVVVAAPDRVDRLASAGWLRRLGARVVAGGSRRQESVAAGVRAGDSELVLVHDAARPLVTPALVDRVAAAAAARGAAIPVVPVAETLKRLEGEGVGATLDRVGLAAAQTPQGVKRDVLEAAYASFDPSGTREFTDEAALLEAAGMPVATVPGEATNLKVTQPADLELAEALLAVRLGLPRAGIGRDGHPFGPGQGLCLGGIVIEGAPALYGHSDGDAALHAVADALLGAGGLGDLGRLFPAGVPDTLGIASGRLMETVLARLATAGMRPGGVDLTIVAGRPRLGAAALDRMRDAIADLLGLDPSAVSVKASSGNLDGPEGEGRSISALAIASVTRTWPSH